MQRLATLQMADIFKHQRFKNFAGYGHVRDSCLYVIHKTFISFKNDLKMEENLIFSHFIVI